MNEAKIMTLTHRLNERLLAELEKDPLTVWSTEVSSAFLGLSPETLRRWRRTGEGPEYIRLSQVKIGYQKQSLLAWVKSRARHSTTEDRTPPDGNEGVSS